jgi:hypothetical protein
MADGIVESLSVSGLPKAIKLTVRVERSLFCHDGCNLSFFVKVFSK